MFNVQNAAGDETLIGATSDDSVALYFNNNQKIVTTNTGVVVTGICTATTFSGAISGTTGTFSGDVSIADKIVHTGDTDTAIRFPAADTFTVETGGSERIRVDSSGNMGLGGAPIDPGHLTFHINNSTSSAATRLHMTTNGTGATTSDGFSLSIDG